MPNKVYVLNKHGRPLMPCSPATARHLTDDGKAKVKKRTPFTIQLLFGSTGYTQEIILGPPVESLVEPEETAKLAIVSHGSTTACGASIRVGWLPPWRPKSKSILLLSKEPAAFCLSAKWS